MAGSGDGKDEDLIVARIRRPHGVRGEVLIAVDTDRPRQVFRSGRTLYLADGRGARTGRTVTVEGIRPTTGGAILRLAGVRDRNQADELRGHALLIAGTEAAPASAGEVHYRDLIGLSAVVDGREIGRVEDILDFPAGETLLVRSPEGKEILVPFAKDLVVGVDLERKVLTLELPEGFLEL